MHEKHIDKLFPKRRHDRTKSPVVKKQQQQQQQQKKTNKTKQKKQQQQLRITPGPPPWNDQ